MMTPNASSSLTPVSTPSALSRWSFIFLLWHICIHFTQPQNRFLFLYPFRIAQLTILIALGLHIFACMQDRQPILRMGVATRIALVLIVFGLLSQYFGPFQTSTAWNGYIDQLTKSAIVLILIEASAVTIYRVWAIPATIAIASLWWVKAGIRLSAAGATYSGDRIMGAAVSMIENPNAFAYFFSIVLPIYLYFFQQYPRKIYKLFFLFLTLCGLYSIFNTGSRTGIVVLVVLLIFLLPKYFRYHKAALSLSGVVVFFLLGAVGQMNMERFKSIPESFKSFVKGEEVSLAKAAEEGGDEHSAVERRLKNADTWALIKEHPLFGVGMNPNESLYAGSFPQATGQVHNEMLMAGRQMGFIGIGLYFSILGVIFVYGLKIQRYAKGWWPAMADLGWTFKLQAVGILVGGSFNPMPWNIFTFVLCGTVSALWLNLRAMKEASLLPISS